MYPDRLDSDKMLRSQLQLQTVLRVSSGAVNDFDANKRPQHLLQKCHVRVAPIGSMPHSACSALNGMGNFVRQCAQQVQQVRRDGTSGNITGSSARRLRALPPAHESVHVDDNERAIALAEAKVLPVLAC